MKDSNANDLQYDDVSELLNAADGQKADITFEERLLNADDPLKFIQNRLVELEESPHRDQILTKFANVMREVAEGSDISKQEKFKEASEAYENSLRLRPGDPESKMNLQYAKQKLKEQQQQNQQNKKTEGI